METSSVPAAVPVRTSGIPRPASRLPVPGLRAPSSSQQLRPAPSTEQLRKKPSVASLSRPGGPPVSSAPLQKKPSRTSLIRPSVSAIHPPAPTSSLRATSSSRAPLVSTKRTFPGCAPARPPPTNGPVFKKPVGRLSSRETRIASQSAATAQIAQQKEDKLSDLDAFRSASRSSSRASSRAGFRESEPDSPVAESYSNALEDAPTTPAKRGARPSLSDRTIETLSHIQSPQTVKGRRSSFFNSGDNSMSPPPLRPTSAVGNGRRPTTSDGAPKAGLTTPNRLGGVTSRDAMTGPGKRSVSANPATSSSFTPSKMPSAARPFTLTKKLSLSQKQNLKTTPRPLSGSKTMLARTPKTRPSLAGVFGEAVSPPGTAVSQTPPPKRGGLGATKTPDSARKVSASSAALREQIAKAKAVRRTEATAKSDAPSVKPASSSSNLREQIAKAKEAARRGHAAKRFGSTTPPREVPAVTENEFGIEPDPAEIAEFDFGLGDPFNQQAKGSKSLLRKRVDAARLDGRLNIAAMGLTEIPAEVLTMYKYDPTDTSFAWGEVVDLATINAADNELQSLPDVMFPDVDYESLNLIDSDDEGPQFGGVQSLDLHGNILRQLPMGLMRLTQLTKLNLSRNQLPMGALDLICQITGLRELRIAENGLEGALSTALGALGKLEVLELQGNKLTSLPSEIRQLTHLRALNVSDNKLRELPVELFTSVPLTELIANKNAFSGSFFNVDSVPHLQHLQLANNSISSLCNGETALLPALKTLNVTANRLTALPDISSWTSLTTLLVGENKLSAFPEGFVSLQQLRTANFTANDLKKIDERIALMEGLTNLTLAANPLRERKFVSMNTEDLKRDLQSRLEPAEVDAPATEDQEADLFGAPTTKTGWQLKAQGVLDLSFQNLTLVNNEAMLSFAASNDVRQILLQQNYLTAIPACLTTPTHLTVLDLSKNSIEDPTTTLHFPKLRELRLKGNKLKTFDLVTSHIEAPALQHLDISNNRIAGALPVLREKFPELIIFHASDNSISEVDASALEGLRSVNLSNNHIARLDPRIGLLQGTLNSFEVEGNTFRVPHYTVLRKGTGSVLSWLRDKIPSPVGEGFVEPGDAW